MLVGVLGSKIIDFKSAIRHSDLPLSHNVKVLELLEVRQGIGNRLQRVDCILAAGVYVSE